MLAMPTSLPCQIARPKVISATSPNYSGVNTVVLGRAARSRAKYGQAAARHDGELWAPPKADACLLAVRAPGDAPGSTKRFGDVQAATAVIVGGSGTAARCSGRRGLDVTCYQPFGGAWMCTALVAVISSRSSGPYP
jgi:hypothetical protein